jgi:ubiquinone/menaquinone biosynthesis C-methylase UbiE
MDAVSPLYGTLAKYYDFIYHWKDYRKEAKVVRKIISENKQSPSTALLDVGCGTGKHLRFLKAHFDCMGMDVSDQMLEVARKNVPGVEFVQGDMTNFKLGRRFGAITCLFSGIGHLRTRTQVTKAVGNFAQHLEPGGVVVIEPWIARSEWRNRTVNLQTYESEALRIARVNYARAEGEYSILDYRYLIAEKGKGITYLRDLQKLRFFELDETLRAMRSAGLRAIFTKDSLMPGRGLLIGVKSGGR